MYIVENGPLTYQNLQFPTGYFDDVENGEYLRDLFLLYFKVNKKSDIPNNLCSGWKVMRK